VTDNRLKRSLRATFVGLAVNAVLAGTKLVAGVAGHSHALVADAIESLADLFSSIVVWRGLVIAAEPADEDHPYGHGKAEPMAAAIVSSLLLLAAGWIAVSAIAEIRHPHAAPLPFTLIVLGSVVCIKELLFRYVLGESRAVDSSAVKTDAWHHRSDMITSLAAAVGISVSLVGQKVGLKGLEAADDVAAVVAAAIVAWNGWHLLRPAINELMDRSPSGDVIGRIRQIAGAVPGVDCVEKTLVRKMGHQFYVDMHVQVDPQMTVQRSHEIAHEVKDRIRSQVPRVSDVLVHIEPAGQIAKSE
jgi:cation diffusion facilitator family transporter